MPHTKGEWTLRASIPADRIPADGQTISRATFPDLAAMVAAGTVPVVSEADWLADPLKRGSYTACDGSTTIRVLDLNGRSTGSLGRVFLSGDGIDSNGAWGVFQRDQFQKHHHYINIKAASGGADVYGTSTYGAGTGSQYSTWGDALQFNPQVGPPLARAIRRTRRTSLASGPSKLSVLSPIPAAWTPSNLQASWLG
ncbi:hypothetical protein O9570_12170 [Achromobacter xylosoxidans]|jgi:hypothetical protein|uniref:Phage tail collar domain-containing protein n=1 Tax=Alcaligenes xylosoxydans xylosoxydans TaxID=85698 RepID=A0A9X3KYB3_ALCXX|nr:hypothetical protein [Achromobacter xylosoxidans]MCZ8402204.1 hypothetical protein [Achromobacter xylosoxidans]